MNIEEIKRMLPGLLPDMTDLLVFGGLGLACYGIAQIYAPAAWVTAGAVLFWLGIRR